MTETWLPTGALLDVVRVGLDPASTNDDFADCQAAFDFGRMNWEFAEVLPLFGARFGSDDGRINGLRKRNFYVNSVTFGRINEAVDLLDASGIRCVLGRGLAALVAYPDVSSRTLTDAELIIADSELGRAQTALMAAGWTTDDLGRMCHESGPVFTLATRLRGTEPGLVVNVDNVDSIVTTITGRPLAVISPAVALVEIAVAAVWPVASPPIRWVVDLELMLRRKPDVGAVVRHARAQRAAHLVRVALQNARRLGARSVPGCLLRRLALVPAATLERGEVTRRTNTSPSQFRSDRLRAVLVGGGA